MTTKQPRVESLCLWAPKSEASPAEWSDGGCRDDARRRFAVADGATNRSFASNYWAYHLVKRLVEDDRALHSRDLQGWCDQTWESWQRFRDLATTPHQKRNFDRGSYAALLAVELTPSGGDVFELKGVSVGDCNLFHTRGSYLVGAWPRLASQQFNATPSLFGSVDDSPRNDQFHWTTITRIVAGDAILLCSDELAKWALRMDEEGTAAWSELGLITQSGLSRLVHDLRAQRRMARDDIVLMQIHIR